MYATPYEMIREDANLSSLPHVYMKIQEVVDDPRSSFLDIADAISKDAALSARLLRIANSALYGFPAPVETITHAISVIGTQQLTDLVLATSVLNQFKNFATDLISVDAFWTHSIACGIAARTLAVYRKEINVERFYVMGLLHDVGRLIMVEKGADILRQAMLKQKEIKEPLHCIERRIMGFDHADVGGALINVWKLPLVMEEAIRHHHNPAGAKQYPTETAIIHIADIIVTAMRQGNSREHYVPTLDMNAWGRLGLPVSLLASVWEQVELKFTETIQAFLQE